jgi:hypothetical protein
MWAEKRDGGKVLAVMPSLGDMANLRDDKNASVGGRIGITQPGTKIELRHLSAIETAPTEGVTRAQLLDNGNLVIFLSEQNIRNWPPAISIAKSSIEILIENERFKEGLLKAAIPEGGVLIDFTQMMPSRSHPR